MSELTKAALDRWLTTEPEWRQGDDDEDDEAYYCPHGIEVPVPGGACYHCAQEMATDLDY